MKQRRLVRIATALALGAVMLVPVERWARGAFQALSVDPLQGADCGSCHLAGDKTRSSNSALLTAPPEQLCSRCHPGALEASHPSGVSPSMAVPQSLPLDWKGNVTCSTCHSIHASGHGALQIAERGAAFCTQCHELSFFSNMADQGGSLLVSGHMTSGNGLEAAQTDEYSVQCMACHDERGQGPGVTVVGGNIARHATGSMEHPIGVDYRQAFAFGGYRDPEQLPPSISLPGGQVSCISCHQGYSSTHGQMVASNEGSNLCFQCHDL
ncbi:cytochrome c3 family protein [Motiliproteus sediminis]|uniref:cytochrome c3 family protein n=1 Tax=Motiliproteus sediminis TaxID=1468178 RepID=UPI001AEFB4E1|nr:cytochrome c3 family protein [Motiliproteus sediminis]